MQMEKGELIKYVYGPLQGSIQMVGRAELFAIVYTLENCLPPILIKTDHLNHVKKIRRGEAHCRSLLLSPYIDLWRRLWD